MLNRVILIGRLGQDPELRHTQSGVAVATFNVAVERPKTKHQRENNLSAETDWIRIVVWDKQAVNCAQFLGRGRLVAIDGRLQINTWTDQQGQKRSAPEVVAEAVRFLDRAENTPAGEGVGAQNHSHQQGYGSNQGGSGFGWHPSGGFQGGNGFGTEIRFPDNGDDDLPFEWTAKSHSFLQVKVLP